MATDKKCVSCYLEKENFDKLKKIVKKEELSMSRFLAQVIVKILKEKK